MSQHLWGFHINKHNLDTNLSYETTAHELIWHSREVNNEWITQERGEHNYIQIIKRGQGREEEHEVRDSDRKDSRYELERLGDAS